MIRRRLPSAPLGIAATLLLAPACGEAEPATSPPEAMPAPRPPAAELAEPATAEAALTGRLQGLRARLESGQTAAEDLDIEVQAAWSVTLRVLLRRLAGIEARRDSLADLAGDARDAERRQIEADVSELDEQYGAELEALRRSRQPS